MNDKLKGRVRKAVLVGSVMVVAELFVTFLLDGDYSDGKPLYVVALTVLTIYLYRRHGTPNA